MGVGNIDQTHAATFAARRARLGVSNSSSSYSLPIASSDAPAGSGFRADFFHRLKVVGCTPARLHSALIETPTLRARCSMSAMTDSWFMGHGLISNIANCNSYIANSANLAFALMRADERA